jgi:hypothetical protein
MLGNTSDACHILKALADYLYLLPDYRAILLQTVFEANLIFGRVNSCEVGMALEIFELSTTYGGPIELLNLGRGHPVEFKVH